MKKNKLILLQLVIAFTMICTSVYAAVNTTIELKTTETTLLGGDTVTVTLHLKDVEENAKVSSIEGYVNYNKDIIEPITIDSIEKDENNKVKIEDEELTVEDITKGNITSESSYIGFNSDPSSDNDTKFVIDFKNGLTKDTDLIKINFKVKKDATVGEVKDAISYSAFVITVGEGDKTEKSEEITQKIDLTVKAPETGDDNKDDEDKNENKNENENTNQNENKNENKNTNNNTNNNTNTNQNTNKAGNNTNKNTNDNTVAGTKLPATGAKVLLVPAIVLIVLAYVSYNRYMKYKDI